MQISCMLISRYHRKRERVLGLMTALCCVCDVCKCCVRNVIELHQNYAYLLI